MTRTEILQTASNCVSVDRTATHGQPEDNFATIARFQNVYMQAIEAKRGSPDLKPHDVAVINILQKIARLVQSPEHVDHWVDIAGYAGCGGECASSGVENRN